MPARHLKLIVADLERSVSFYKALGLILVSHNSPVFARFTCLNGDATLSLAVTQSAPVPPTSQLFFECEAGGPTERPKVRSMRAVQDPTDLQGAWREARLWDPDGHSIRLYFARDS